MSDMPFNAPNMASASDAPPLASDTENPYTILQKRLISITSMTRPQRIIMTIGVAVMISMTLLALTDTLPQPTIAAGSTAAGAPLYVPDVVFAATVVALFLAFSFALTGALISPWYIRLPIGFGMALLLGFSTLLELATAISALGIRSPALAVATLFHLAQFVTLLALCAFTIPGLRRARVSIDTHRWWPTRAFFVALALMLLYYGLEFVAWAAVTPLTHAPAFQLLADSIAEELFILPVVLAVVIYWAFAGLTEWGDLVATGLAFVLRKSPRGLWLTNTLAALGALAFAIYHGGLTNWPALIATACLLLMCVGVAALARPRASWPIDVPVVAIVIGAALLLVGIQVVILVTVIVDQGAAPGASQLYSAQAVFGVVVMALGLMLAASGRAPSHPRAGVVGLLLFIIGGIFALIPVSFIKIRG